MPGGRLDADRVAPKQGKIVLTISSAASGQYERDQAYHTMNLIPAVNIPPAQYVSAKIVSANVWNSVPNVFTGKNDVVDLDISEYNAKDLKTTVKPFSCVIPQGQYAFADLVATITRNVVSSGFAQTTINFSADTSSGYVYFSTSYKALTIKASPQSVFSLLGLDSKTDFIVPTDPAVARGPNRAALNNISSFILHSSIASPGIAVNGRTSNILGVIPITAKPNRLIVYTPAYPIEVNAESLQSSSISQVISNWTTEDGTTPAPMYEDFSYTVEISYFS